MAAAAEQLDRPRRPSRPPLRLVVNPRRASRRRAQARRDGLYAMTLATLLATGIVVVLLLNTAMQTQADGIAASKHRLTALSLQIQTLQVDLDRAGVPAVLAARAQALHLRPATRLPVLAVPRSPATALASETRVVPPRPRGQRPHLTGRERAAFPGRAG